MEPTLADMSKSQRRLLLAFAAAVGLLVLSACTAGPGSATPTSTTIPSDQRLEEARPAPPEGRVIAVATVIDTAGDVRLCGATIMDSLPPQCHGIPIDGWSWEGLEGNESSGGSTWGAYAVYGTYDGKRLTVTDEPIMLALYDPIAPVDPAEGAGGEASQAELERVADELGARLSSDVSANVLFLPENGYVSLQVTWDDGTIQKAVDAEYGDGVVVVTSQLREVDE